MKVVETIIEPCFRLKFTTTQNVVWSIVIWHNEIDITSLSNYMMVFVQRKRMRLKKTLTLELFVEKFTVYNPSPPHKYCIPDLKHDYAHVILDPT